MILRVLAVSMIGFTLAGCVSSSGLSGDVYSASEAKQVQSVTYGTIVHTRAVQIQSGDDSNAIGGHWRCGTGRVPWKHHRRRYRTLSGYGGRCGRGAA